jgi:hypothetical protein
MEKVLEFFKVGFITKCKKKEDKTAGIRWWP